MRWSGNMPFSLNLWPLQKQLNPHTLCGFLCALHRKSATGRGFDAPTKKQQNLRCKREDTKGPWKWDSSLRAWLCSYCSRQHSCPTSGWSWLRLFSSSGIAQFLGLKEEVISLAPWDLFSCSYWGGSGGGGSSFLLFWSDGFFLEIGK